MKRRMDWCATAALPRLSWWTAAAVGLCAACSNSASSANATIVADASPQDASSPDATGSLAGDAALADGSVSESAAEGGAEASTETGTGPGSLTSSQALVRLANWAPDSPPSGYDVCFAPVGTTSWIGPLLAQDFDAGALGPGGANSVQFPNVTTYVVVPPGEYDIVFVTPGGDCSGVVIESTTELASGTANTIALVGTVNPTGNDAPLEIETFTDDTTAPSSEALLRFIDADPTVAAAALGTGDLLQNDFVPLFSDAEFASIATQLADGGTADPNGYAIVPSLATTLISAHAVGAPTDLATATHSSISAGTATTIVLINGSDSDPTPPQLLACTDSATAAGALSPCKVLIAE